MLGQSSLMALFAASPAALAAYQGFNYGSTFTSGAPKVQSDFEAEFKTSQGLISAPGVFNSARLYTTVVSLPLRSGLFCLNSICFVLFCFVHMFPHCFTMSHPPCTTVRAKLTYPSPHSSKAALPTAPSRPSRRPSAPRPRSCSACGPRPATPASPTRSPPSSPPSPPTAPSSAASSRGFLWVRRTCTAFRPRASSTKRTPASGPMSLLGISSRSGTLLPARRYRGSRLAMSIRGLRGSTCRTML